MNDQRRGWYERKAFDLPCTLLGADTHCLGRLRYLSFDAAWVLVPEPAMRLGEMLTLRMHIPWTPLPFQASGEVNRLRQRQGWVDCVLRLNGMSSSHRIEISRLLDSVGAAPAAAARKPPPLNRRLDFL